MWDTCARPGAVPATDNRLRSAGLTVPTWHSTIPSAKPMLALGSGECNRPGRAAGASDEEQDEQHDDQQQDDPADDHDDVSTRQLVLKQHLNRHPPNPIRLHSQPERHVRQHNKLHWKSLRALLQPLVLVRRRRCILW